MDEAGPSDDLTRQLWAAAAEASLCTDLTTRPFRQPPATPLLRAGVSIRRDAHQASRPERAPNRKPAPIQPDHATHSPPPQHEGARVVCNRTQSGRCDVSSD